VQGELALTSYQIASGGQSESDTEKIKFVQREVALTYSCKYLETEMSGNTCQDRLKYDKCKVTLHIPAAEEENEKRRHVRTK
jgi:hypothetical protein